MIRTATLDDIPEVLGFAAEFLDYSPHRWIGLDVEAFTATLTQMIEGPGVVFLSDDGFIGGALAPAYFNPSVILAAELFWFARQEGPELRQAFEAWARENGASAVTCTGLVDHHEAAIRRVYARAGYEPSEIAFMKRII